MQHTQENAPVEENSSQPAPMRIVVAVDTSRQSRAALEEAAVLAALMQAELEGLFVEDINLLHLCGFPFCNQIGSYTAKPRRMDNRALERELRGLAVRLRREIEQIAQQAQVPWRFHVRRGPVVAELLDAARNAGFFSLGRAGTAYRRTLGSTAQAIVAQATRPVLVLGESTHTQPPLILIYTDDDASRRALQLAIRIAPRYQHRLQIWHVAQNATALATELEALRASYTAQHDAPLAAEVITFGNHAALAGKLRQAEPLLDAPYRHSAAHHTVILPGTQAALLPHHMGPAILVP